MDKQAIMQLADGYIKASAERPVCTLEELEAGVRAFLDVAGLLVTSRLVGDVVQSIAGVRPRNRDKRYRAPRRGRN